MRRLPRRAQGSGAGRLSQARPALCSAHPGHLGLWANSLWEPRSGAGTQGHRGSGTKPIPWKGGVGGADAGSQAGGAGCGRGWGRGAPAEHGHIAKAHRANPPGAPAPDSSPARLCGVSTSLDPRPGLLVGTQGVRGHYSSSETCQHHPSPRPAEARAPSLARSPLGAGLGQGGRQRALQPRQLLTTPLTLSFQQGSGALGTLFFFKS